MAQAISAGPVFLDSAHWAVEHAGDDAAVSIEQVSWVAAVDPPVIRDGLTFPEHMQHFSEKVGGGPPNPQLFKTPGYFKGSTGVVYGHDQEIPYPGFSEFVDYELEMGLIVGAPGRNLTPQEAVTRLFGVTIFNDFSARDIQGAEMGMGMGPQKCKDFAYGIGPWITTIDELPPIDSLVGTVRVNGQEWATTSSDGMIYSPEELLAYVSIGDNLQPGDLIGSGTLPNGSGLELDKRLSPGDVLELELTDLGEHLEHAGPGHPGDQRRGEGRQEPPARRGRRRWSDGGPAPPRRPGRRGLRGDRSLVDHPARDLQRRQ